MEPVFGQLLATLLAMWWPFVRLLAMLSFMPVVGENMVPVTVRVLLALALAVVLACLPGERAVPVGALVLAVALPMLVEIGSEARRTGRVPSTRISLGVCDETFRFALARSISTLQGWLPEQIV